MFKNIKQEFIENRFCLLYGYLLISLTMIPQMIYSPNRTIYILLLCFLLFFISKLNKFLFAVLIFYIVMTNIVIGHIFVHWGYLFNTIQHRIDVAVISPPSEIFEYLKAYIDYRDILIIFYNVVILFLLYRYLKKCKTLYKILKVIGLVGASVIIVVIIWYPKPLNAEPFGIINELINSFESIKLGEKRTEYLKSLVVKKSLVQKGIYDKIVIIQGEAANKYHLSLYGYAIHTTPFLSSLKKEKNFYIFNAISPTDLTSYSVPIMYTKANVHHFSDLYIHSRSIIGDFIMNGYKTHWISSQGKVGEHDFSIYSLAQEADIVYYQNLVWWMAKTDYNLIEYLENYEDSNDTRQMYFIHLMGSHAMYSRRYTKDKVLFPDNPTIKEQYDNTIYYTDYILKNIFLFFLKKFSHQKILFVYVSDHGEVVDEKDYGHGHNPSYKDIYEVPFVIYSTIKNKHIEEISQLNKSKYFNLENLNYMIEYINGMREDANISYSDEVFVLNPDNIQNYELLPYYKTEEKTSK